MIASPARMTVLQEIDAILRNKCGTCTKREEMNRLYGCVYSRIDGYCNRECPVGKQLQELGKLLGR